MSSIRAITDLQVRLHSEHSSLETTWSQHAYTKSWSSQPMVSYFQYHTAIFSSSLNLHQSFVEVFFLTVPQGPMSHGHFANEH